MCSFLEMYIYEKKWLDESINTNRKMATPLTTSNGLENRKKVAPIWVPQPIETWRFNITFAIGNVA